jgi:hypothetical protein
MSESQPEYDPMALRADVDASLTSRSEEDRIAFLRLILGDDRVSLRKNRYMMRDIDIISCPELFGEFGPARVNPPIAPD